MKKEDFKPVNLWVAVPVIMQIAIAGFMMWGFNSNAWNISWICNYFGVIVCMELFFYNNAVKRGDPFKALYPIVIMLGFAFFFLLGFVWNGWSFSWIGLAAAAVAVLILMLIDKATAKKRKA